MTLFVVSLARINCLVQTLIILVDLCVMLVHVPKLINCHIKCLLVIPLLLYNLFFLMCGNVQLNLLATRNITCHSLMTIVNSYRSIYSVKNLMFSSIFLNSNPLLSACSIERLFLFNLIGVGSMNILIPFFTRSTYPPYTHQ
jgi:hypothetical protein